jgi:hypothetical protein
MRVHDFAPLASPDPMPGLPRIDIGISTSWRLVRKEHGPADQNAGIAASRTHVGQVSGMVESRPVCSLAQNRSTAFERADRGGARAPDGVARMPIFGNL